eukprot:9296923-Prorocentrum_lima.AAC.1
MKKLVEEQQKYEMVSVTPVMSAQKFKHSISGSFFFWHIRALQEISQQIYNKIACLLYTSDAADDM